MREYVVLAGLFLLACYLGSALGLAGDAELLASVIGFQP